MFLPIYFLNVGEENAHWGHSTHHGWWPTPEAACRKRGRADKNEEGQPFYAFTEQICRITHASSTCLKRQCSISFVCFGLGVSFLFFFFKPELPRAWFGSLVAEVTHVECQRGTTNQSKSQRKPGSCLFKGLIAPIAFSHPHEPDLPFTGGGCGPSSPHSAALHSLS